jgi:dsDNA-specific endonuclease/ATPase MutS2
MSNEEIEGINQRLEAIEKAINELDKSVKDLSDYVKGEAVKEATEHAEEEKVETAAKVVEKVDNAEEAMHAAHAFMKKDNAVALPLKAQRRDDFWLVDVDIGAVRMEIVRVKIDAKTGEILGHETVETK